MLNVIMLSVVMMNVLTPCNLKVCHHIERHFSEFHYAECRAARDMTLNSLEFYQTSVYSANFTAYPIKCSFFSILAASYQKP